MDAVGKLPTNGVDVPAGLMDMPKYRSHKIVYGVKIAHVVSCGTDTTTDENPIVELHFEDTSYAPKRVNLRGKPTPEDGWYMVQYEDGYISFSPAPQFEAGNTLERDRVIAAARAAHEANSLLCQAIGDFSQPSWDSAPDWQCKSAIAGVEAILANPATSPEQSHEGWLKQKAEDGWKYGPVKDPEKKEHPCFVPYSELPPAQRVKDHMFGLVVRAVLNA